MLWSMNHPTSLSLSSSSSFFFYARWIIAVHRTTEYTHASIVLTEYYTELSLDPSRGANMRLPETHMSLAADVRLKCPREAILGYPY